eukprot:GHVS01019701.1.p1 GENE.GHVS01019701.1~~GHVS01019701.1.p1  ORF type:complete len:2408 (-),score=462.15 GHVS01019701.1:382-7605(-)
MSSSLPFRSAVASSPSGSSWSGGWEGGKCRGGNRGQGDVDERGGGGGGRDEERSTEGWLRADDIRVETTEKKEHAGSRPLYVQNKERYSTASTRMAETEAAEGWTGKVVGGGHSGVGGGREGRGGVKVSQQNPQSARTSITATPTAAHMPSGSGPTSAPSAALSSSSSSSPTLTSNVSATLTSNVSGGSSGGNTGRRSGKSTRNSRTDETSKTKRETDRRNSGGHRRGEGEGNKGRKEGHGGERKAVCFFERMNVTMTSAPQQHQQQHGVLDVAPHSSQSRRSNNNRNVAVFNDRHTPEDAMQVHSEQTPTPRHVHQQDSRKMSPPPPPPACQQQRQTQLNNHNQHRSPSPRDDPHQFPQSSTSPRLLPGYSPSNPPASSAYTSYAALPSLHSRPPPPFYLSYHQQQSRSPLIHPRMCRRSKRGGGGSWSRGRGRGWGTVGRSGWAGKEEDEDGKGAAANGSPCSASASPASSISTPPGTEQTDAGASYPRPTPVLDTGAPTSSTPGGIIGCSGTSVSPVSSSTTTPTGTPLGTAAACSSKTGTTTTAKGATTIAKATMTVSNAAGTSLLAPSSPRHSLPLLIPCSLVNRCRSLSSLSSHTAPHPPSSQLLRVAGGGWLRQATAGSACPTATASIAAGTPATSATSVATTSASTTPSAASAVSNCKASIYATVNANRSGNCGHITTTSGSDASSPSTPTNNSTTASTVTVVAAPTAGTPIATTTGAIVLASSAAPTAKFAQSAAAYTGSITSASSMGASANVVTSAAESIGAATCRDTNRAIGGGSSSGSNGSSTGETSGGSGGSGSDTSGGGGNSSTGSSSRGAVCSRSSSGSGRAGCSSNCINDGSGGGSSSGNGGGITTNSNVGCLPQSLLLVAQVAMGGARRKGRKGNGKRKAGGEECAGTVATVAATLTGLMNQGNNSAVTDTAVATALATSAATTTCSAVTGPVSSRQSTATIDGTSTTSKSGTPTGATSTTTRTIAVIDTCASASTSLSTASICGSYSNGSASTSIGSTATTSTSNITSIPSTGTRRHGAGCGGVVATPAGATELISAASTTAANGFTGVVPVSASGVVTTGNGAWRKVLYSSTTSPSDATTAVGRAATDIAAKAVVAGTAGAVFTAIADTAMSATRNTNSETPVTAVDNDNTAISATNTNRPTSDTRAIPVALEAASIAGYPTAVASKGPTVAPEDGATTATIFTVFHSAAEGTDTAISSPTATAVTTCSAVRGGSVSPCSVPLPSVTLTVFPRADVTITTSATAATAIAPTTTPSSPAGSSTPLPSAPDQQSTPTTGSSLPPVALPNAPLPSTTPCSGSLHSVLPELQRRGWVRLDDLIEVLYVHHPPTPSSPPPMAPPDMLVMGGGEGRMGGWYFGKRRAWLRFLVAQPVAVPAGPPVSASAPLPPMSAVPCPSSNLGLSDIRAQFPDSPFPIPSPFSQSSSFLSASSLSPPTSPRPPWGALPLPSSSLATSPVPHPPSPSAFPSTCRSTSPSPAPHSPFSPSDPSPLPDTLPPALPPLQFQSYLSGLSVLYLNTTNMNVRFSPPSPSQLRLAPPRTVMYRPPPCQITLPVCTLPLAPSSSPPSPSSPPAVSASSSSTAQVLLLSSEGELKLTAPTQCFCFCIPSSRNNPPSSPSAPCRAPSAPCRAPSAGFASVLTRVSTEPATPNVGPQCHAAEDATAPRVSQIPPKLKALRMSVLIKSCALMSMGALDALTVRAVTLVVWAVTERQLEIFREAREERSGESEACVPTAEMPSSLAQPAAEATAGSSPTPVGVVGGSLVDLHFLLCQIQRLLAGGYFMKRGGFLFGSSREGRVDLGGVAVSGSGPVVRGGGDPAGGRGAGWNGVWCGGRPAALADGGGLWGREGRAYGAEEGGRELTGSIDNRSDRRYAGRGIMTGPNNKPPATASTLAFTPRSCHTANATTPVSTSTNSASQFAPTTAAMEITTPYCKMPGAAETQCITGSTVSTLATATATGIVTAPDIVAPSGDLAQMNVSNLGVAAVLARKNLDSVCASGSVDEGAAAGSTASPITSSAAVAGEPTTATTPTESYSTTASASNAINRHTSDPADSTDAACPQKSPLPVTLDPSTPSSISTASGGQGSPVEASGRRNQGGKNDGGSGGAVSYSGQTGAALAPIHTGQVVTGAPDVFCRPTTSDPSSPISTPNAVGPRSTAARAGAVWVPCRTSTNSCFASGPSNSVQCSSGASTSGGISGCTALVGVTANRNGHSDITAITGSPTTACVAISTNSSVMKPTSTARATTTAKDDNTMATALGTTHITASSGSAVVCGTAQSNTRAATATCCATGKTSSHMTTTSKTINSNPIGFNSSRVIGVPCSANSSQAPSVLGTFASNGESRGGCGWAGCRLGGGGGRCSCGSVAKVLDLRVRQVLYRYALQANSLLGTI